MPVMHFGACPIHMIHYKVHLKVGRRLGSCRLISVQPMIGSIIRAYSISFAQRVLKVQCSAYWHSFYQTDHSSLPWLIVGVIVTFCRECRRTVFWARSYSSCALRGFFILENELIGYAVDSTLMAVVPSPGVRVTEAESLISELCRVIVSVVSFGEWNWMRVRPNYDSLQVTHNAFPVTPINCWRNCTEGVWWPCCYIRSYIWFQDHIW